MQSALQPYKSVCRTEAANIAEIWRQAQVDSSALFISLSDEVHKALESLVTSQSEWDFSSNPPTIPTPLLRAVRTYGEDLVSRAGLVVLRTGGGGTAQQRQIVPWIVAHCLGELLVQDSDGNRLIHVFDRDRRRRMSDGARYHQTREGGSLHTDNVNAPAPWEFLVFGCIEPALIGGESVLAHADLIHRRLEQSIPEALEILRRPFHWEYRGIADALYQAPIITYDDKSRPHFRYLRPYLESAHQKAGEPLTEQQTWALDVLDSAMELSEVQLRLTLQAGDVLITHDSRILHGRTSFADHLDSTTVAESKLFPHLKVRRSFERAWVKSVAERKIFPT
jgi:alpha-ketoglutarate-dependent taurine dioxygenase